MRQGSVKAALQVWQPFGAKNIPIKQPGADEINIILMTTIVLVL